jgi:ABC-2 type transport system permease protein
VIRGLVRKTVFETWVQLFLFCLGLFVVGGLLTMFLPQVERGANQVLATFPFVRHFLEALLGQNMGRAISPQMLQSIIWVHPTVLALFWAQEIVFCTRLPAGEIDRGTIDVLLGWPVSRRTLFTIEAIMWLGFGLCLVAMLVLGHYVGRQLRPSRTPHSWTNVFIIATNLYSMYVAVGGIAFLISALSNRRGRAMAGVFGLVLATFLLNFLVQFWPQAEVMAPLGVLNYYRPAQILATGEVPLFDIAVLLAVGLTTWLAAMEVFARRSICTV